ncbi:Polyribonucleotide nucleotidyltransferase [Candidatus Syntrophocurvum alkaliphilum]|uniref:Polyribonucleotide nucleotidyltransferase n=1 Tax=Candidatus Syntrophocurvum alkaliphilum TaxID=2293317 RepID=A0A6I6DI25_9FIRM|nr:polyribonucleotide nucleotidyltransferase [Candidatus Syntrophocurvum alkaliphilum]QGT99219.1 Polyribonucleotide nucleotidyltransferase [Candidatus Syntrophocurvum alkaliphilum]
MHTYKIEIGGRQLVVEVGKVAKQANGAAVMRYGDTVVLVTATASKEPREGIDFFPLTVDYEERLYAAGKIPGGFIKREGRPTEFATLSARLIDRPLRPLFPNGYRNDVNIVATVMSMDNDNIPDVISIIGASVALTTSNIPFSGPVAAVTVGLVDGEFIINPTVEQSEKTKMHLTVAGTKDAIMMVEAGADEIPEDQMLDAIFYGHEEIKKIVEFQEKIIAEIGEEKIEPKLIDDDPEIEAAVRDFATQKLEQAVRNENKKARESDIDEVKSITKEHFQEIYPEQMNEVKSVLEKILKEVVRKMTIYENERVDGRKNDEIRAVTCEVGYLPRPHGTGLFTRGQTQVLSITTLGSMREEQILDGLGADESKRYIHHYNFPPWSVGEARPMRGPGRREIGHGALAERALLAVLPSEDEFPYTIRVVSDVLESNGSTSMGSVCGSSLSLMHAGVPIKATVSGIAMGLVKEGEDFAILSDIQGIEDALGDMDFKVAGTKDGITALQMDIKITGVSREIIEKALAQANDGRMFIMSKMLECISEPNKQLSPYAPQMIRMQINPDKIREVIGAGGKTIQKIVAETDCKIDIEDDGSLFIISIDEESANKAKSIIETIIAEVEVGKTYMGTVKRIMDFGAFVEIIPGVLGTQGKEGLVHISQLAEERVNKVKDVVNIGDQIMVKVIEIDQQGRINLSRKAALNKVAKPTN